MVIKFDKPSTTEVNAADTKPKYVPKKTEENSDLYMYMPGKDGRKKKFVLHKGLLKLAHKNGALRELKTELVSYENGLAIVKARAVMQYETSRGNFEVKIFEALGDAGLVDIIENGKVVKKMNTNRLVGLHPIRMAGTRAVNRALRFALNIGETSLEELGGDE